MNSGRPETYTVRDFFADVDREFAFLVAELGFVRGSEVVGRRRAGPETNDPGQLLISDAAPLVRFGSGEIQVSIGHDPRSEIQVLVRRPDRPPGSVDVEGMARGAGAPNPSAYSGMYSSSTVHPAEVLRRLAVGLRDLGIDWLS